MSNHGPEQNRFLLAASLEPCVLGEEASVLPAHITIVPPFKLPKYDDVSSLDKELRERLEEEGPITVIGRGLAQYGHGERQVTVREVSGLAFGVHAACYALVKHLGGVFDESHTGTDWSPHVTRHKTLQEGEMRVLPSVQLFRYMKDSKKSVAAVYELSNGQHHETAA